MALSATLALTSMAVAGTKGEKTKSQEKTARAACLMGDYQKGTKILVDLFLQTGNPVHLFNQGRCYEQNHRWQEALDRFHEFLRKAPELDEDTKTYVSKHIAECESHLPKAAVVQTSPPPSAPSPPPPAPPSPPPTPTPAASPPAPVESPARERVRSEPSPVTQPTERPLDSSSGSGLRTAGIIVGGLGVGGIVAGVLLNSKVNGIATDLEKPGKYSDGRESDRKTYEAWGWVSYGLGAACLTTGAVLYLVGHVSGKPASVALVPALGAGETGAVVRGAF